MSVKVGQICYFSIYLQTLDSKFSYKIKTFICFYCKSQQFYTHILKICPKLYGITTKNKQICISKIISKQMWTNLKIFALLYIDRHLLYFLLNVQRRLQYEIFVSYVGDVCARNFLNEFKFVHFFVISVKIIFKEIIKLSLEIVNLRIQQTLKILYRWNSFDLNYK